MPPSMFETTKPVVVIDFLPTSFLVFHTEVSTAVSASSVPSVRLRDVSQAESPSTAQPP